MRSNHIGLVNIEDISALSLKKGEDAQSIL